MTAPDAPTAMTLEEALAHLTNGARDYAEQLRNRFPGDDAYSRTAWDIARRIDRSIEVVRKATRPVGRDDTAELVEALAAARRAIGEHNAPNDCYATGPITGDAFRDLVECPACTAIPLIDAALAAYEASRK